MKTLNDLLTLAIQDEISAQKLYQDAHDKFSDEESRQFMKKLVEEEKKHEALLKEIRLMDIYDGTIQLDKVSRSMEGNPIHSSERDINPDSSLQEILEIALEREYKAKTVYSQMAAVAPAAELKTLFTKLAEEEENHHKRIAIKFSMQRGEMGREM